MIRKIVIAVNFIRRYVQETLYAGMKPHAFENVDRAEYIGFVRVFGHLVGIPDQRLSRQMQNAFRLIPVENLIQRAKIADIADHGDHSAFDAGQNEQIRIRRRVQRIADHFRPCA